MLKKLTPHHTPLPNPLPQRGEGIESFTDSTSAKQGARETVKLAFTLAEVLITLAIIGIVAALTIPTLITKIQHKELVTRYKRVYSVLNQAYKYAENEYGSYTAEDWNTSTILYERLKPYMKLSCDSPADSSPAPCGFSSNNLQGYTYINGKVMTPGHFNIKGRPVVRLITGEFIIFYREGHGVHFMVDLNGDSKPNRLGVDFYYFSIINDRISGAARIVPDVPWGLVQSRASRIRRCDKNSQNDSLWHPGSSCGYWILKHNNMDYLNLSTEELEANW